jgi:hypothetical protein
VQVAGQFGTLSLAREISKLVFEAAIPDPVQIRLQNQMDDVG